MPRPKPRPRPRPGPGPGPKTVDHEPGPGLLDVAFGILVNAAIDEIGKGHTSTEALGMGVLVNTMRTTAKVLRAQQAAALDFDPAPAVPAAPSPARTSKSRAKQSRPAPSTPAPAPTPTPTSTSRPEPQQLVYNPTTQCYE